jgi:hypothetical protein
MISYCLAYSNESVMVMLRVSVDSNLLHFSGFLKRRYEKKTLGTVSEHCVGYY